MTKPIVFYDGVCILCNGFVQFIVNADQKGKINFATLQSATAQKMIDGNYTQNELDTVVLLKDAQVYTKSTAVIEILKSLGGLYAMSGLLYIFPLSLRDFIYDIVASNRYKWFGKKETCLLPSLEQRKRFIDI
jgi:predicted DCC family thiol-disulfide oxidoreductase YuxK